jgi:hypothetical protein
VYDREEYDITEDDYDCDDDDDVLLLFQDGSGFN